MFDAGLKLDKCVNDLEEETHLSDDVRYLFNHLVTLSFRWIQELQEFGDGCVVDLANFGVFSLNYVTPKSLQNDLKQLESDLVEYSLEFEESAPYIRVTLSVV